ncbi:MAG: hypothetical protein JJT78_10175, partial [Leptospira sp.]|nr:hypothetical protein [Leptospira sp.]
MKSGFNKTCQIDTTVYEMCPKNCRSILKSNSQMPGLKNSCIAKYKMNFFLEGETTFNVGISAFYQAHPDILNEFINERKENMELISYYLSISDPDKVSDIVEGLSDSVIFNLFKENYESFLSLKDDYKRNNKVKNFFQLKSNRFWEGVSFQKICKIIAYTIRNYNDY